MTSHATYEISDQSLAAIFSLEGVRLEAAEKLFFTESNPLGFILFGRNCESPDQLRALIGELYELLGRKCPILIDQEGGRVQRLKPPQWRPYPAMQEFGDLYTKDADRSVSDLRFTVMRLAEELRDAGINVNCAPVLDVLHENTHEAVGDRAFSGTPEFVAILGRIVCEALLEAGVTPVIKHLPGHGRSTQDSHHNLPVISETVRILEESDFLPFRQIAKSEIGQAVWGMSAHLIFEEIDSELPASLSPKIIRDIIRGSIGFDGFLVSDDVDMKALDPFGDIPQRCLKAIEAGNDAALYCWAKLDVMEKIAETVPKLRPDSLKRLQNAAEFRKVST